MNLITTKSELLERLKDVRIIEVVARKGYEQDIMTFKNPDIISTMEKIKGDKEKHIPLLDELIALLST